MINTKQGVWLLGILGFIMVILVGILIFAPAKKSSAPIINGIEIISPKLNEEISSPLKITGVTNGWNGFEGQVGTVKLFDSNSQQLGQTTILSATTDWTKPPISFTATLNFISPNSQNVTLVFYSENPSGLPQYDKTFSLPIKIRATSETMFIKAYFTKDNGTGNQDCSVVLPVDRVVPKTQATATAAINELLKGPTNEEKVQGYFTNIPVGSKLNSISIINGEARVDFNGATESGGGSCSMAARVAQITNTLMQFPIVTSVRLSVDGKTGDLIFQP